MFKQRGGYLLFKEDAEMWVATLKKAITSANKTYSSESKSGWLQKESSKLNVKGRYFILKNNLLMWFTSSVCSVCRIKSNRQGQLDNMKVKGAIQLAGCSVTLDEALYVKTSQGKRYKLLGSSEELSGWFKALEEAIVRANQVLKCRGNFSERRKPSLVLFVPRKIIRH